MWELIVMTCTLICTSESVYVESLELCQAIGQSYEADLIYCRTDWPDRIVYEFENGGWVYRGGIAL